MTSKPRKKNGDAPPPTWLHGLNVKYESKVRGRRERCGVGDWKGTIVGRVRAETGFLRDNLRLRAQTASTDFPSEIDFYYEYLYF